MEILVRLLGPGDESLIHRVVPGVFGHDIIADRAAEFLRDPRHHLAVAIADERIVGLASAVHYVHPDKDPEMWINEVSVAPAYQRKGLAKRLLDALFVLARSLGCGEAWVLTDPTNEPALALYRSAGGQSSEQVLVTFRWSG